MVTLNKIYTRNGDDGSTALGSAHRVAKNDPRVEAYGTIDELNAHIGVIIACINEKENEKFFNNLKPIIEILMHVQNNLFDLGADLCMPASNESDQKKLRIQPEYVVYLENKIDAINQHLTPLKSFILPGGTYVSSHIHVARTVCRRAERKIITLKQHDKNVTDALIQYVNRLSDLLFVLSRHVNQLCQYDDVLWLPAKKTP